MCAFYLFPPLARISHAGNWGLFVCLLQALTAMLEESTTGTNLSRKATLLVAEILQLANRVLPLNVAAKIQVKIQFLGPNCFLGV